MKQKQYDELMEHYCTLQHRRICLEAASTICGLMLVNKVTRAGLAKLLGCERNLVTKYLSGDHNFTMETLADVTLVLGACVHLKLRPLIDGGGNPVDSPDPSESDLPVGETVATVPTVVDPAAKERQ